MKLDANNVSDPETGDLCRSAIVFLHGRQMERCSMADEESGAQRHGMPLPDADRYPVIQERGGVRIRIKQLYPERVLST